MASLFKVKLLPSFVFSSNVCKMCLSFRILEPKIFRFSKLEVEFFLVLILFINLNKEVNGFEMVGLFVSEFEIKCVNLNWDK